MADYEPALDAVTLRKIRRLIGAVPSESGGAVPRGELLDLASELGESDGLTIDFNAAGELGHPLVVLRPLARPPSAALAQLSQREREVAALIGQGLSNKSIARELGISLATVKDHVHSILDKTGLPSRLAVGVACLREDQLKGP